MGVGGELADINDINMVDQDTRLIMEVIKAKQIIITRGRGLKPPCKDILCCEMCFVYCQQQISSTIW